jgi:ubiquinone/menaquinone biosynthesis C-methylase UbiE
LSGTDVADEASGRGRSPAGAGPAASIDLPRQGDARWATIADAFSRTAKRYDEFGEDHPHLDRMRGKVYAHVGRTVPPGSRILELNAGTGIDAVQLARRGFRVHATDIAPGMLARLRSRVDALGLDAWISSEERSFLELDRVAGAPYDAIFSNLGGLNCVPDLRPVVAGVNAVLRPGGFVVWVVMPPICLWELALVFTGQFRLAFRRLARKRVRAHLEGRYFDVAYFTPGQVVSAFGDAYELLSVEGLSVLTPTAESKNLAKRHRTLYRALAWLDDRLAPRAPVSGWGDFFIVSLRRRSAPPSPSRKPMRWRW